MKKMIALLLAWIMMFSVAVPAFAAEGEPSPEPAVQDTAALADGPADMQQEGTQGETVPVPEGETAPVPEGETAPAPEGETAPAPEGETTPVPEGETAPAPEGETTPAPEGETTPAPEGEATPAPEGEMTPVPEDETTPAPEGETTPVPEGETTPAPEGETTPAPTEEPTPTPEAEPSATPEAEETPEPEPTEDQFILISDLPAAVGQVDVTIVKAMDLGDWTPSFTATLRGGEKYLAELTVAADGVCCSFCDVPTGDHNDYTLTISGRGFATYEQSINVGRSDGVRIQLTVGRMAGYENCAHPGILQLGDVDGNGAVDSADALLMMQAVDLQLAAEGGQTSLGFTDLNMDGVTNLADAEYLAKGLDIGSLSADVKAASLEHYIPESAIAIGATEYTEASGKENLFEDNGGAFTLGRKDGGEITAAAPVAVSLDMAEGAQAGVILLDNTNILSGIMEITYEDGTVAEAMIGTVPEPAAGPAIAAEEAPPAAGEAEPAPTEELPAEPEVPAEPAPETVSEVFEVPAVPMASLPGSGVSVSKDGSGNITVDLGGRKAIKRVTLKITETTDHGNLASISQVEFVNGMQDRIPEPALDIPQGVSALGASRQFTVTWSPCVNVTGYEVEISADGVTEIVPLAGTSLTVTNFNNDEVRNYTTYQIRVQSVNGAWSSGWSNAVSATPKPAGKPDKPDNVTATGGFQTITVTWKNMKDTVTYNVYYKADGEETFTKVPDLTGTSYVISGLSAEVETEYEVYVTGVNEFGESDESIHASARTTTLNPPEMPQFNLINRSADGTPGTDHITSAVIPNTSGAMVNSPLDTGAGTAWGTVDGNPASFYERATWNDGGWWNMSSTVGLIYTFDQAYEMDTIGMMSTEANMDFTYVRVRWWDADGAEHMYDDSVMRSERRTDSMGRTYFFLRMPEPITTSKIQVGVARYWAGNNRVAITDVYFYKYDDLKRQINELYADDLHTTLVETVTEEQLNDLKARIESSVDEFNHVNPDKDQLLKEWETAWEIYHDQFMGRIIRVHTGITASGDEHGFGGLNAWQPLGVTAAAGETVTIYVGNGSLQTGGNTNLELVITQYHAEASAMSKVVAKLKVGANEVQLPEIWSSTGVESGGALYVQYTGGASSADNYAVRVSGGTAVPVLDLYHVADAGERASRTEAYLAELQTYAAGIPTLHSQIHQGEGSVSSEVDYDYNERNCILGATDIMLDTMMLSIPAQQVVSGCGGSAATLLTSLDAMEDMMALFYQHKGLNAGAPNAVDRIPNRHLNIRYQRMFSGAFMYASGDHIGIEWTETDDMAGCPGVQADANGLYIGGNYFGWGIAHEIGHDINQGCYAIAEITNNYFAVLAQAKDTNDSVRFDYKNVYDKVTSGTKGSAGNVFTQLGMYWQLHLAYDRGYNFKTYANYDEQLANLFYARVDAYARTPANAPKPGGVELTLQGADVDQTIMRLACAAAQKNLLDFFQRWGKTPDETTVAYASQFPEETRAIYYVCDDSRRYTLEHSGPSKLNAEGTTQAVGPITVAVDANQANKVNISIAPGAVVSEEEVLGYEIVRCTIAGGKVEKRTVGFTTENTFEDVVYAMNNRTVYYEVTLVDQYLNRSACVVTETVKIQHEGDLDKTSWTVVTTGLTPDPTDVGTTGGDEDMPEVMEEDVALRMVDGKVETIYKAAVAENACIEVDFHDTQVVTGFRYTAGNGTPIGGYTLDVCQNGEWQRVDTGELGGGKTVYFSNADGKYVSTYAAEAIRLTLTGQVGAMISVAELDMLGLTGDNVDFGRTDSSEASIGYLTEAFQYGADAADVIPKGSLVFTGSYKGNAAYNVVILYDQDGNVVAGEAADGSRTAYQTILSDVPETGNIQDVNDGIWIYWVQPEDQTVDFVLPKRVRVELYRVNNALTNEGERLVSDSLFVDVPTAPGDIALTANG